MTDKFHKIRDCYVVFKKRSYYKPEQKWRIYLNGTFIGRHKDYKKALKLVQNTIYRHIPA